MLHVHAALRPGEKTAGLNGSRAGKLGARPSLIPAGALWEASPQNPHSYPGGHHNGIQDGVTMVLAGEAAFFVCRPSYRNSSVRNPVSRGTGKELSI